jgi:hypothetical protein
MASDDMTDDDRPLARPEYRVIAFKRRRTHLSVSNGRRLFRGISDSHIGGWRPDASVAIAMLTFAEPTSQDVRRFLIESERRIVLHCRKLLQANGLALAERHRLSRLLGEAERDLQRLSPGGIDGLL